MRGEKKVKVCYYCNCIEDTCKLNIQKLFNKSCLICNECYSHFIILSKDLNVNLLTGEKVNESSDQKEPRLVPTEESKKAAVDYAKSIRPKKKIKNEDEEETTV